MQVESIEKVELHRHLDGSVRLETIRDLLNLGGFNVGIDHNNLKELSARAQVLKPLDSLQAVLGAFDVIQKAQYSTQAIKRVVRENIEDLQKDNVVLGELRFAPAFLAMGKDLSVEAIVEACVEEMLEHTDKIQAGLILIAPRSLPLEPSVRALRKFLELKSSSPQLAQICVGFDLADMEDRTDKLEFVKIVEMAKKGGLGITVHSGEDTTAKDVLETVNLYEADRIGHGIKSIGDPKVIELLIEKNIHLEVCPTSNYLTKSINSLGVHPIRKLYDAGVSIGVNSDDPHLMGIDLNNEYKVVSKIFGFDELMFKKCNEFARKASFLSR